MGFLNKIKQIFKGTPNKRSIKKKLQSWFKFYNSELATNETIFSAVTMKANAIASAPVGLYKNYDKIAPIDDHLAKLFKYGPNPRQSMFSFMQYMESTRNTSHGAYAIIEYDKNMNVKAIWPLHSEYVQPVINEDDNDLWYEIREFGTGEVTFIHNSHIIALEYLDNNGLKGINPLDVLKNTIDYDNIVKEFSINQMKNSLKANAVITINASLSPELLEEYDEMMEDMQESGIIYIDDGKEFKEISNRNYIDPNILQTENITIERVERVFNMVGKLTKGSISNSKNTDPEDLLYLKDSILPVIRQYEQEFSRKLLDDFQKDCGYEIKINLNGFMRAQASVRGNFYQVMFRNGLMTKNEIRSLEDLPPTKDGDKFYLSRDLCPEEYYMDFIQSSTTSTKVASTKEIDK
ncbi:MAG: phage portal protein [Clostridium sp.]|nr:phage portal protein [Clostridium sp.]